MKIEYIEYQKMKYKLLLNEYQILSNNDEVRFFGVAKATKKQSKWIGKIEKYHWYYMFSEMKNDKIVYFYIEVDYFDVAINKKYYC